MYRLSSRGTPRWTLGGADDRVDALEVLGLKDERAHLGRGRGGVRVRVRVGVGVRVRVRVRVRARARARVRVRRHAHREAEYHEHRRDAVVRPDLVRVRVGLVLGPGG